MEGRRGFRKSQVDPVVGEVLRTPGPDGGEREK